MGVTTGTHWFLSSTPSFSPFSSTPAWALHRPQLLSKKICSSMDSALAAVLPEHPSAPARVLHRLQGKICSDASFSAVSHSFCSPLLCPPDIFWLFLNMFALRHQLGWWAQLCRGGSIAEASGNGCVWQEAVLDPFPQRPHLQPPHPAHTPNTSQLMEMQGHKKVFLRSLPTG